jgi:hypothetical protein
MRKKRKAIALPLVLVIVLVGGALVAAAFYITENYYSSSKQVVTSARLYNAAVSGIEEGKGWIYKNMKLGHIPRWTDEDGDGMLSESDKPTDAEYIYEALIAKVSSTDEGVFDITTEDGIKLHVVVYDLAYEPHPDLTDDYEKGFPPRIRPQLEEGSSVVRPSYAVAGRGRGSTGEGAPGSDIGVYLIRCTAIYKDRTSTAEQAVAMRL